MNEILKYCLIGIGAFIAVTVLLSWSMGSSDINSGVTNTNKVNQMNYDYLIEVQEHVSWFIMLTELDASMMTDTAYGRASISECTLWMGDSEGLYNQLGQDLNEMVVPLKYVAVHNTLEDSVLHMEMAIGYLADGCGSENNLNKATTKIVQATDEMNQVTALLELM